MGREVSAAGDAGCWLLDAGCWMLDAGAKNIKIIGARHIREKRFSTVSPLFKMLFEKTH